MDADDYRRHDAVGLAALISRGEVGAAEVLEAAIAVADAVDPDVGAIVLRMDRQARDRVREPLTGPMAGVPFLIKDMTTTSPVCRPPPDRGRCGMCRPPSTPRSSAGGSRPAW